MRLRLRPFHAWHYCPFMVAAALALPLPAQAEDDTTASYTECLHNPLKQFKLVDCSTLLDQLATLHQRYSHGEDVFVPTVLVLTKGGKEFRGCVVDTGVQNQKRIVLMELFPEGERFPDPKAAYIDESDISAVSIPDAAKSGAAIASLTEGNFEDPSPLPTKLEIKRKMARFSTIVSETLHKPVAYDVDWNGIKGSGEELRNLSRLMSATTGELVSLAQQQFNRTQIAAKLKTVQFGNSSQASVRFKNGVLSVSNPIDSNSTVARSDLAQSLEKAL